MCRYRFLIYIAGDNSSYINPHFFYLNGWDNMGFHFAFWKKQKIGKLIGGYVSDRVKEKRAFQEQLKRLDSQLQEETIDQQIYERLRDVLEVNFIQQREKARTSIQINF